MKTTVDLHVHTHMSDGTFSPEQVIECARERELSIIAITDHDCIDGIMPAMKHAAQYGIEVIPGVELTVEMDELEVHILGYFVDHENKDFEQRLRQMREIRIRRTHEIIEKLKKFKVYLDADDVFKLSGPGAVGRLHIAKVLYNEGYVSSIGAAFKKYIGNGGPCYVKKFKLTYKEAIDMLLDSGAVPVLAHPHVMGRDDIIPTLVDKGLRGLEVYHVDHPVPANLKYEEMAQKYGLIVTGGSDCHGLGKGHILMGSVKVPDGTVEALRSEAQKIRSRVRPAGIGSDPGNRFESKLGSDPKHGI